MTDDLTSQDGEGPQLAACPEELSGGRLSNFAKVQGNRPAGGTGVSDDASADLGRIRELMISCPALPLLTLEQTSCDNSKPTPRANVRAVLATLHAIQRCFQFPLLAVLCVFPGGQAY